MRTELICIEPAATPRLSVRSTALPRPRAGELLVRIQACAINPIDLKRASGYGRRLLSLKGAGRFPLVLGNDLAGVVEALGPGVQGLRVGQRVFGLLATGRQGGSHASHACVPQGQLRASPAALDDAALAVLPYSFTTLWLALRGAGLNPGTARGARVLVHGAAGGLGRLALQQLQHWGSRVTAIAGRRAPPPDLPAETLLSASAIATLPSDFDAVLNFASWDDDALLASRLAPHALGQATTVHPLLGHFDRLGWLRGALANRRAWQQGRAAVAARAPQARYAWTVFKPDGEALDALADGLRAGRLNLPIGTAQPLRHAALAFAHVAQGQPGRALLLP